MRLPNHNHFCGSGGHQASHSAILSVYQGNRLDGVDTVFHIHLPYFWPCQSRSGHCHWKTNSDARGHREMPQRYLKRRANQMCTPTHLPLSRVTPLPPRGELKVSQSSSPWVFETQHGAQMETSGGPQQAKSGDFSLHKIWLYKSPKTPPLYLL